MLAAESTCYGAVSAEPTTCYSAVSAWPTTCYGAVSAEPIICCLHLQSRLHIFTAAYLQYMSAERHRYRERELGYIHLRLCLRMYLSIIQSQFIEKCLKKTGNVEHSVVLLLFLFTLDNKKRSTLQRRKTDCET